ncbi:acyl-CoA synthetase [Streptomyces sp. 769]|nr:acyl-CoA synthetase [Streptomyces sp. 769]
MTELVSEAGTVCALLADGSTVSLRPAGPADRERVLRLYDAMSADSLRNRFFMVSRRHKTERGGVLLDLRGAHAVRTAYRDLTARLGPAMTGALVQPMARRGTELLADHAARLAPLTDTDVHELLTAPRCAPLLLGHRGAEPVDLASLKDLLARLSQMADDLPELAGAECNPVIARPDGSTVVDARVRLLPRRATDPYLRRLP